VAGDPGSILMNGGEVARRGLGNPRNSRLGSLRYMYMDRFTGG
jgi:hypothetical protein